MYTSEFLIRKIDIKVFMNKHGHKKTNFPCLKKKSLLFGSVSLFFVLTVESFSLLIMIFLAKYILIWFDCNVFLEFEKEKKQLKHYKN